MVFASPVFLFLFLPAFLGLYYLAPVRWRSGVIVAGSSVFYGWWRVDFLAVLYGVILWSWGAALLIEKRRDPRLLWAGVVPCLLTLGYFKYRNFGIETLRAIFLQAGSGPLDVLLPVGISFFVFHAVSYIVDVWRRDAAATRSFLDYAAFITLFPHLVAGPVLRYKDLAPQFRARRHGLDIFSEGAFRFMAGFAKKVLIADAVAPLADAAFALENPAMADAWLGAAAYAVQLYFDFSGYSDMAAGLALMMGFRFVENFNLPYLARNITDFWRRWHISLAAWLRDYVYIPLGGNRKGPRRTLANLFLTMLLGGIWHGAGWTFVLWGAWHGALLVMERLGPFPPWEKVRMRVLSFRKDSSASSTQPPHPTPSRRERVFSHLYLLLAVLLGWVMFRAPDVMTAFSFYKAMSGLGAAGVSDDLAWQIRGSALFALSAGIAVIGVQPRLHRYRTPVPLSESTSAARTVVPSALQILTAGLFLLAVSRLLAFSFSPFLYFQF